MVPLEIALQTAISKMVRRVIEFTIVLGVGVGTLIISAWIYMGTLHDLAQKTVTFQ